MSVLVCISRDRGSGDSLKKVCRLSAGSLASRGRGRKRPKIGVSLTRSSPPLVSAHKALQLRVSDSVSQDTSLVWLITTTHLAVSCVPYVSPPKRNVYNLVQTGTAHTSHSQTKHKAQPHDAAKPTGNTGSAACSGTQMQCGARWPGGRARVHGWSTARGQ